MNGLGDALRTFSVDGASMMTGWKHLTPNDKKYGGG